MNCVWLILGKWFLSIVQLLFLKQINFGQKKIVCHRFNFSYMYTLNLNLIVCFVEMCQKKFSGTNFHCIVYTCRVHFLLVINFTILHIKNTGSSESTARIRQIVGVLGPVHTMPDKFENATLLLRIRLPSTLIRIKRSTKTEHFENALQSGTIWKRYFFVLVWTEILFVSATFRIRWRHFVM